MTTRGTKRVINVAIVANLAIAGCKYLSAAFTKSPSMLAEAIHSTVDTGNELLLLFGIKRSARPPDQLRPYGHGKALYFYSLLVAVYIFGAGSCFAIYRGIGHLRQPAMATNLSWAYAVLALSAMFELYSLRTSYRELQKQKDPNETIWGEIIASKDPSVFTIFLEDSAGLIGTFLAFIGILLGSVFHNPYFDPSASILIGILLAAVAVLLGRESGALLVGERTNPGRIRRIREVISGDPMVEEVGDLLTMQLGPDQVLLTVDIRFRRGLDVQELESAIDRLEDRIHDADPTIYKIFIEADSLKQQAHRRRRTA